MKSTERQSAEALERAQLQHELAEGYAANSEQARSACEEWDYVSSELI